MAIGANNIIFGCYAGANAESADKEINNCFLIGDGADTTESNRFVIRTTLGVAATDITDEESLFLNGIIKRCAFTWHK